MGILEILETPKSWEITIISEKSPPGHYKDAKLFVLKIDCRLFDLQLEDIEPSIQSVSHQSRSKDNRGCLT